MTGTFLWLFQTCRHIFFLFSSEHAEQAMYSRSVLRVMFMITCILFFNFSCIKINREVNKIHVRGKVIDIPFKNTAFPIAIRFKVSPYNYTRFTTLK